MKTPMGKKGGKKIPGFGAKLGKGKMGGGKGMAQGPGCK